MGRDAAQLACRGKMKTGRDSPTKDFLIRCWSKRVKRSMENDCQFFICVSKNQPLRIGG